jgi:hypothetical protein
MTSNRNVIIGAIVAGVVVVAAYFLLTAQDATPPAPSPTATSEQKK